MKCYNKIVIAALALFSFASCADFTQLDFATPVKPLSIAQLDSLNLGSYKTLKSYVDTVNFKLGAGISATDLAAKGPTFRTIISNFNEITPINEFKHGSVVANDGTFNFATVDPFLLNAKAAGLAVYGHALVWSLQQNSTYLNSTIAPVITSANPQYVPLWSQDFEPNTPNASGSAFSIAGGTTGYTAVGAGKGGVGRALTITNTAVQPNDWDVQLFFTFPKAVKTGDKVRLTMDIKSDVSASYPTQAHTAPGAYKFYDFFGSPSATSTWTTYVKEMTVTADQDGCNTIAFNLGKNVTVYYFDNAKVEIWDPNYGASTIVKTDAQKTTIIDSKLDSWIGAIVKEGKNFVKAWDVVNEPLADNITDPAQYTLKTGIGRTLASGEFYWQDYLGKDYAVKAITYARKYGNATDKLFVSDYGLEAVDQIKCLSLVNYVSYIESKGVKVDGIGTELHVVLGKTSLDGVKAMFTNLAKTGKLIKITQLDMGISTGGANLQTSAVTFAQLKQMSDFYKDIVKAYIANIPAAQRYGITTWSIIDSPTGTAVKVGEPVGLWFTNNTRKPAYAGFANGLQGK